MKELNLEVFKENLDRYQETNGFTPTTIKLPKTVKVTKEVKKLCAGNNIKIEHI